MSRNQSAMVRAVRFEAIVFATLLGLGISAVPIAAYYIGVSFFSSYDGGDGTLGAYLGRFYKDLFSGWGALWLVVLAPWLTVQALRIAGFAFRRRSRPPPAERAEPSPKS